MMSFGGSDSPPSVVKEEMEWDVADMAGELRRDEWTDDKAREVADDDTDALSLYRPFSLSLLRIKQPWQVQLLERINRG